MKRQMMKAKKDRRIFRKTSKNTKKINVGVSQYRGGVKL